jgi:GTP-binding protein EngB required for normal cell division
MRRGVGAKQVDLADTARQKMLRQLHLQNFRCFDDHTITFESNTVVVGKNNAGKSSVIETWRLVSAVVNRRQVNFVGTPGWRDFSRFRVSELRRVLHTSVST